MYPQFHSYIEFHIPLALHPTLLCCVKVKGGSLFTGSADGMIRCWSCNLAECIVGYRGHKNTIVSVSIKGDLCKEDTAHYITCLLLPFAHKLIQAFLIRINLIKWKN